MTTQLALLPGWLDPANLINAMGAWAVLGIMLIIFAECGILLGFFLPGDTLLFVSGLFIASGAIDINLWLFIALVSLAAFVGNMVGLLDRLQDRAAGLQPARTPNCSNTSTSTSRRPSSTSTARSPSCSPGSSRWCARSPR